MLRPLLSRIISTIAELYISLRNNGSDEAFRHVSINSIINIQPIMEGDHT